MVNWADQWTATTFRPNFSYCSFTVPSSTACTIAIPRSFSPNLITAILSTINSLNLNYPASSKSITVFFVLSLKFGSPTTPILRSLHWLKIIERIEYKLLLLTYKVLTTTQPLYLHNPISVQLLCCTRSPFVVTLAWPKATDIILSKNNRSILSLRSALSLEPTFLSIRQRHSGTCCSISYSPVPSLVISSSFDSPRCSSITPSFFHSQLKTNLFY